MISTRMYKCPSCKHIIPITNADFIKGVAMVSCGVCGTDAFTITENITEDIEDLLRFLRGGFGAK